MRATTVAIGIVGCCALAACAGDRAPAARGGDPPRGAAPVDRVSVAAPLIMGHSFTIDSRIMGETRRVNVFMPTVYGEKIDAPMPVLYMLDGGMDEDFLHIAGLLQVLVSDGSMRPFMLVGIPNTSRRRDLTGPTSSDEDKKIAPVVGGSAAFRHFIKDELMPEVRARYHTTDEAAIIGESLAGLFVVETFFLDPDLFSTYIAFDPSVWWNNEQLVKEADARLASAPPSASAKTVFIATSNEPGLARLGAQLAGIFNTHGSRNLDFRYVPLPAETHATIYHPAALLALRTVFAPPPASAPAR